MTVKTDVFMKAEINEARLKDHLIDDKYIKKCIEQRYYVY